MFNIFQWVGPANGPRPAIGKCGLEEKLRGEVFGVQGVEWTAVMKSLKKNPMTVISSHEFPIKSKLVVN